ncbi:tetratricopeptide repeat protein [uncultured Clostridium sp.]|uniref:tetratricopeptide repeat protein n=1 Tax=uncultured Clostridium sp. TaxID=59620 RepID=UPI0028E6CD97|nr:tetratricopeptide repeat protein [uncultured Clostridium sp.]
MNNTATSKDWVDLAKNNKKILAGILSAILIISTFIYYQKTEKAKFSIVNNKAEQYYYNAEFDKAIQEFNKLYEKDKSPLWKAKIAQVYSVTGDLEKSRKYLEEIREVKGKSEDVTNLFVFTEYMNKDFKKALEDGEEALKSNPKDKQLIKTMFAVYMANDNYNKAKEILSSYPVDEKSSYDMAEYSRMLMLTGDKEKGLSFLRKAWDIDKDEFKIYDVLVQIALNDKDTLLEDIHNLSTKNSEDVAYKMWMAKIYSMSKNTVAQATNIMDSIKDKDIGKIEKAVIEATIKQDTNKDEEAEKIINDLLNKHKGDYRVLHNAGWFYLNKDDLDKAEEYAKQSLYKNEDYPDNYAFLMPQILKKRGKTSEIEPYFRKAMFIEPYNYNIMLAIANHYWNADNDDGALEYFKFAEIIKPEDAEIKYNMAIIHLSKKEDDKAVDMLKKTIELKNDVPKYHRTLGTIYYLNGKNEEAIKEIRFAYEADKNDPLTLNNAGCYYITVPADIQRGVYNLQAAVKALTNDTDEYTKKTVKDNYEKAKKLYDDYEKSQANTKLKIPDLIMFY